MHLQRLTPTDQHWLPALTSLLQDTVEGGASLGFLAPLDATDAQAYRIESTESGSLTTGTPKQALDCTSIRHPASVLGSPPI